MNILVINGSPKKKGGTSAFFSKVLGFMLFPQKVMSKTISVSRNYDNIFVDLNGVDIVIISTPLYVDSIPLALGALFHGKTIFSLYKKIDYTKNIDSK
jgi:multimeric flavodoxin WrbA